MRVFGDRIEGVVGRVMMGDGWGNVIGVGVGLWMVGVGFENMGNGGGEYLIGLCGGVG